jgi:hypothetical protein
VHGLDRGARSTIVTALRSRGQGRRNLLVTNCTAPWHGLRPFSQRAKQARASRKQHTINRPSTPGSRASIPDSSPYPRTPPPGTRGTLRKLWRGQAVATAGHGTDTALHHDPGVDGRDPGARIRIISARQIGSSSRATSPQSSRLLPRCTAAIRWPRPASSPNHGHLVAGQAANPGLPGWYGSSWHASYRLGSAQSAVRVSSRGPARTHRPARPTPAPGPG